MTELITLDRERFSVSFGAEAKAIRTQAMILAVEIDSVTDAESQAKAVEAQQALQNVLNAIEKDRRAIGTVIECRQRAINAKAREFVANVVEQKERIGALVSGFHARRLSIRAALNEELTMMEHKREAELAVAPDIETREEIRERYAEAAETASLEAAKKEPPQAPGQTVREDWEIEIIDLHLLATRHRTLVNIEPRIAEIKQALNEGRMVHGIEFKKVVVAGVRAKKVKELAVSVV